MGGRRVAASGARGAPRRRLWRGAALALGAACALLTFQVQRLGPDVLVASVSAGTADDVFEPALVAGWPVWWVQDAPGVSVWGTLSPIGEDHVRLWAFGADAVLFAAGFALLGSLLARRLARGSGETL